ncbi:hypothetical protein D920_02246 [Enterococcus faecalis 13-SD-W-01]|nr:hypothetical protein D920_02246 [Enterococcus faecalis 13-SD-W-01]
MIILVLILSVLLFAFLNVFAKKTWQTFVSFIFGAIFVASLGLLVANISNHFGMEKVTETKTADLVSSADSDANMLLYQPLGDGSEKVYLYKTKEDQKKPTATGTDSVTNKVVETSDKAQKETKTTYWVYKNDMYKFWFGLAGNDHEYDKKVNTFKLPEDWVVLSTDQAKELAKLAEKNKPAMEEEAKSYIQQEMMKKMAENPKMSKEEQAALTKELAAQYQKQAFAKMVEEVKK